MPSRRRTPRAPAAARSSGAAAPRPRAPRKRRAPDEARAHILAAAERVFARALPDMVGLKEIAREAGVSHALVTHYFGTYAGLVEAVLEGRFHRLRDALVLELAALLETAHGDIGVVLAAYRRAVARACADPVTIRLATWALLSGRVDQQDFIVHRVRGLAMLADALEAKTGIAREDLEFCLVASFALTITWSLGRGPLSGALGRRPSKEADAAFEAKVTTMLEAYVGHTTHRSGWIG